MIYDTLWRESLVKNKVKSLNYLSTDCSSIDSLQETSLNEKNKCTVISVESSKFVYTSIFLPAHFNL